MTAPRDFTQRFLDLEREVRMLRTRSPFANTGISITAPGQFEIDGSVTVTGDFIAEGKISNDALVAPVAPGSIYDSRTNFALTTTLTNIRTTTITVPAGFTRAAVSIVVRVHAFNNNAGLDYLYAQANIAGYNGYALPLAVSGSGGSGTNVSPFSAVLSDLTPGGSFTVQIAAQTAFASWAADTQNTAEVSGSVLWFR
jgi:hypothetical protein